MPTRCGTTDTSSTSRRAGVVEPRRPPQHRVADRGRQLRAGPRAEQLGDVERVPARQRVQLAAVVAGQGGDGARRERGELDERRRARDGAERGVQRMARRRLAAAEREHQQRGQRGDPPPEHGDDVERRVVGPVQVLEHQHRRLAQLGDQQRLDLVRRRAGRQGARERRRDSPARSRNGPSGRGIDRSSQAPQSTRAAPRSRAKRVTSAVLPMPARR